MKLCAWYGYRRSMENFPGRWHAAARKMSATDFSIETPPKRKNLFCTFNYPKYFY